MYPFQIHSIFLSSFASLIGPFGGFFASGFKRAFKIKVALNYSLYIWLYKCCFCFWFSGWTITMNCWRSDFVFFYCLSSDLFHLSPPVGLRQHYPRPRRHHGSVWLSIPDGHIHTRLYRQFHPVSGAPEARRLSGIMSSFFKRGNTRRLYDFCRAQYSRPLPRRGPNPSKLLQQLLMLQPEQQLSIFHTLQYHLRERNILPPAAEWQV